MNGDYDQGEEGEEGRRSRKSASVSSSVSVSGSEAVVFCRGNVETEIIPNQDVGVEFGFNVLENTTYLVSHNCVKITVFYDKGLITMFVLFTRPGPHNPWRMQLQLLKLLNLPHPRLHPPP